MKGPVGGDAPEGILDQVDDEKPDDQCKSSKLGFKANRYQNDEHHAKDVLEDLGAKKKIKVSASVAMDTAIHCNSLLSNGVPPCLKFI